MIELFKQWTLYLASGVEASAAIIIGIAAIESTLGAIELFIRRSSPRLKSACSPRFSVCARY